jgi:hypothetical protein
MSCTQRWSLWGQAIDLQALATELATLRQQLRQAAKEPAHDTAVGAVAAAEMAAKAGAGPQALAWLRQAGPWALEHAAKIRVGLATAALKTALG